ncbi:hypothetical protein FRC17_003979 [Serendipita sp. 399]|nr:hypothetical protein FRC17_003979 [Serendipita sp. 399]
MLFIWLVQAIVVALVARAGAIRYIDHEVDDFDFSITYSGTWESASTHPSPLNYGGSHTLGTGNNARAVFTFTGVSVYYLASLWPYKVDSYISLDGGPPQLVDMTAPAGTTAPSGVTVGDEVVSYGTRWSAKDLANTTHTVTITQGPSTFAVVDGFRYTVPFEEDDDHTTAITSSTPRNPFSSIYGSGQSTLSAASSSSSSSTSGLSAKSTAIITAIASILGTLILVLLCFLCFRRRKHKQDAEQALLQRNGNGRNELNRTYNNNPPSYYNYSYGPNNNGSSPLNGSHMTNSTVSPVFQPAQTLPPGAAAPVFAPVPAQTPGPPRVEYREMDNHPINPAFNPQMINSSSAAMASVTTLPQIRQ